MSGDLQVDIAHAVVFVLTVTIVIVLRAAYSTDAPRTSIANVFKVGNYLSS